MINVKRITYLVILYLTLVWLGCCSTLSHKDDVHIQAVMSKFAVIDTVYYMENGIIVIKGMYPDSSFRVAYFK